MGKMYVYINKRKWFLYNVQVGFSNPLTGEIILTSKQFAINRRMLLAKAVDNIYWGNKKLNYIIKDIEIVNRIDENFMKDLVLNLKLAYCINIPKEHIINDYLAILK